MRSYHDAMRPLVPIVSILLLLAACNGSPTEPRFEAMGTLNGRVVFVESGAPAAGARIVASQSWPGTIRAEGVADAAGNYGLRNLGAGDYVVSVYAPGSQAIAFLRTILIQGVANNLDVQISGNQCVTIDGTATDRITRRPVSGAIITYGSHSAMTGIDGAFSVSLGCPPPDVGARLTWSVRHPQYHPREFPWPVPSYSTTNEVVLDPL